MKHHRLETREATDLEEWQMESWQIEHRTERQLDEHGFRGDDEVVAILGDMEDEVTMDDLTPHVIAMSSRGPVVQMRSRYDATKPPRSPVVATSGGEYDPAFLSEGEDDGDGEGEG